MRRMAMIMLCLLLAATAHAKRKKRKKRVATADADYKAAPSYKYGQLSAPSCYKELKARKIHFTRVDEARGVLAPVRIPKGVGGVRFHTVLPPEEASESPWEVFDCRLVLALHDFAGVLAAHHIDDVLIFSAWRPNRRQPKDKQAIRHPGGLAVDIFKLGKLVPSDEGGKSNTSKKKRVWTDVKKDWHGRIGSKTCGKKAAKPKRKRGAQRWYGAPARFPVWAYQPNIGSTTPSPSPWSTSPKPA